MIEKKKIRVPALIWQERKLSPRELPERYSKSLVLSEINESDRHHVPHHIPLSFSGFQVLLLKIQNVF